MQLKSILFCQVKTKLRFCNGMALYEYAIVFNQVSKRVIEKLGQEQVMGSKRQNLKGFAQTCIWIFLEEAKAFR